MKLFLTLSLSVIIIISLISCQDKEENKLDESKVGRNNYAVVWDWETTDRDHILKFLSQQAHELNDLWKKDIVENVYIDSESEFPTGESFSSISFVIKAKSEADAKVYLDNMIFVKNKIASFNLYRVGIKYLGRNKDFSEQLVDKKSFVAVFQTTGNSAEIQAHLQEQSDKTLELFKNGVIENAYLDIEGFSKGDSDIPAIVYHVNASNAEEAKNILDQLPFVQKNLTRYQIFPVGVFWLGQTENKLD